jgi:threonine dehydrogenase-like Zn-dependent dehydrogenase
VKNAAQLQEGQSVAVVGAGGVGSNIISLARVFGAKQIVAVDVRQDKLQAARALGATDVIDARSPEPLAQLQAMTDKAFSTVIFEPSGAVRMRTLPDHPFNDIGGNMLDEAMVLLPDLPQGNVAAGHKWSVTHDTTIGATNTTPRTVVAQPTRNRRHSTRMTASVARASPKRILPDRGGSGD